MLKKLGLYVHIPFCVKKCRYCDFNSFSSGDYQKDIYEEALVRELDGIKPYVKNYYLDSVFLGGGTPSVMGAERLKRITDRLQATFLIDSDAEFTIEVNPKTAGLKDFKEYKKMGINRVSMGVQSLNDPELKTLGRCHSLKDFLECYASLKIAGFENVNYDIMFAFPGQTLNSFEKTVTDILKFEPAHISCYGLQLEQGTFFYSHQNEYKFINDETNRKMYDLMRNILKQNGFNQYEISNFSKNGFESRHNLKYWSMDEYIGMGLGSSSFFDRKRYDNPHKFSDYLDFTENFRFIADETEKESEDSLMGEFMFLGLRKTSGIDDNDFNRYFGKSFFSVFGDVIEKHIKNGLLKKEDKKIMLTEKGMDLANTVMCDFV